MKFEELWTKLKLENKLTDEYKKIGENFYKLGFVYGLLHAADQDEKANKGAFISQSLEYSAAMHRQAAQEVK